MSQSKFNSLILETERLLIRKYQLDDFESLHGYAKDPNFSKYEPWGPNDIEETKDFIFRSSKDVESLPAFKYELTITLKSSGQQIARCGLRLESQESSIANIEWAMNPVFQNNGYVIEAVKRMMEFGFENLNLLLIYATCDTRNTASARVRDDFFADYPGEDKRCVWYCLKNNSEKKNMLDTVLYRKASFDDALLAAKLHSVGDSELYKSLIPVFQDEFRKCDETPDTKSYYLAFSGGELIAFAGARFYDQERHESMYGTKNLLPSGWYLRGIRVRSDWQRLGVAKKLTQMRMDWLKEKSQTIYVFLNDENKETTPMYKGLGFSELSRGWSYTSPEVTKRGLLLLCKACSSPS